MSNWLAMKTKILDRVRKPSTVQEEVTRVELAIVEAVRFNSTFHFYFNEARREITLESGVYEYSLPADFIQLIGSPFYKASGWTGPGRPMDYISLDYLETKIGDSLSNTTTDSIREYSLFNNSLFVFPVPAGAATVRLRYVKNVGIITEDYSGGAWTFTYQSEDTLGVVSDSYVNTWFTEGHDLTIHRALYNLWANVYQGEDGATAVAQAAQLAWLEEKNRLMRVTTKKKGPPRKLRGSF